MIQTLDKGYCFAGFFTPILANGCTGSQDVWLLKVDSNFCESSVPCGYGIGIAELEKESFVKVFPNPAKNDVVFLFQNQQTGEINVTLFDVFGKIILEQLLQIDNNSETVLDLQRIPSGTYFYRISHNDLKIGRGKIIVLK